MSILRRLATLPVALVSAVAVTFGVATPADASAPPLKRQPKPKAIDTSTEARSAPVSTEVAPLQYTVREGDTISGIAERFGLPTASVLALNGLGWSSLIFPGQVLALVDPVKAAPAPEPAIRKHIVADGDTVSGIAAAYGLDTHSVLSANGLSAQSLIFPGQAIVLPDSAVQAAPRPATPAPAPAAAHLVAAGDTASAIAARHGVGLQALLDANGLDRQSIIYPGQELSIPGPAHAASAAVAPTAGSTVALSEEMAANARIIIAVGRELGVSDRALVVALAAAAQESSLLNVGHGDRDSLGLFQQRPSQGWGSAEEVSDPVRASRAFFGGPNGPNGGEPRGLLDIDGWETLSVTEAAQAVQLSAYPDHYAKWEASARRWLDELG